jgi:hypothetical protein
MDLSVHKDAFHRSAIPLLLELGLARRQCSLLTEKASSAYAHNTTGNRASSTRRTLSASLVFLRAALIQ